MPGASLIDPFIDISMLAMLLAIDVDVIEVLPRLCGFDGLWSKSKYCKRSSHLLGVLGDKPKD
jgi:hypothetical protein